MKKRCKHQDGYGNCKIHADKENGCNYSYCEEYEENEDT